MEAQVTKFIEARYKAELNENEVYRDVDEAIESAAQKVELKPRMTRPC